MCSASIAEGDGACIDAFLLPVGYIYSEPESLYLSFGDVYFFFERFSVRIGTFDIKTGNGCCRYYFPAALQGRSPVSNLVCLVHGCPKPDLESIVFIGGCFSPKQFSLFVCQPFGGEVAAHPDGEPAIFGKEVEGGFVPVDVVLFLPGRCGNFHRVKTVESLPRLYSDHFGPSAFQG